MSPNPNNEIDLEKLFYRILFTIKRFAVLIILCLVFGGTLGYFYNAYSKKIYGSKMLVSSPILTNSYAKELIDNVNLFLQEGNLETIQTKLGISPDVARKIVRLSTESGLEDYHALEEKERVFVTIRAQMTDPSGFKELEKGIVYYFENNEFSRKLFAERKKGYEDLVKTLDKQLTDMELLKSQLMSGEFGRKNGSVSIGLGELIAGIGEVAEMKRNASQQLVLIDGIQLVDGFTAFSEPQWPRKSTSILLGVAAGLFLASTIIIIKLIADRMAKGVDL